MDLLSDSVIAPPAGIGPQPIEPGSVPGPGSASPDGAAAEASFASVLGRAQRQVEASAGDAPAPGAGWGPPVAPVLSEEVSTEPGVMGDRQAIAASFALQWAALVSGAVPEGSARKAEDAADGEPGGSENTAPSGDAGAGLGPISAEGAWAQPSGLAAALVASPPVPTGSTVGSFQGPEAVSPGASGRVLPAASATPLAAAAVWADGPRSAPTVPALVAVQISPQLSVITPADATAASDDALVAFAAGQGFDAVALQRMFGREVATAASESGEGAARSPNGQPGTVVGVHPQPGLGAEPRLGSALGPVTTHPAPVAVGSGGLAVPSGAEKGVMPAVAAAVASAGTTSAAPTIQGLRAFGSTSAVQAVNATAASPIAPGAAVAPSPLPPAAAMVPVGSWESLSQRGGLQVSVEPATSTASPAGMTASAWMTMQSRSLALTATEAGPSTGSASAMGLSSGERAERPSAPVAASVGSAGTAAWGAVEGPSVPAPRTESTPQVLADAQPIDLRDHLEQSRDALSRRLGEALAARVLSQVERGEWQVRLSVAPQHLGPIDIELQMRGSRLEAQFQVANGQTQALIQDSIPRLREAVGASGMDLASAWVSGGLADRNRGNPTPGQPDGPAPQSLNEGGGDEQAVSGVESVESRGPGWTPRPGAVDILI